MEHQQVITMPPLLIPLVQTTALTSSGLFTGYTWALSHAAIPAVLHASDPLAAAQWQVQHSHSETRDEQAILTWAPKA
jgi:hypothetical protein